MAVSQKLLTDRRKAPHSSKPPRTPTALRPNHCPRAHQRTERIVHTRKHRPATHLVHFQHGVIRESCASLGFFTGELAVFSSCPRFFVRPKKKGVIPGLLCSTPAPAFNPGPQPNTSTESHSYITHARVDGVGGKGRPSQSPETRAVPRTGLPPPPHVPPSTHISLSQKKRKKKEQTGNTRATTTLSTSKWASHPRPAVHRG